MKRLVVMAVLGVSSLVFVGPALAFQCPKLITQITNAAGNRFFAGRIAAFLVDRHASLWR